MSRTSLARRILAEASNGEWYDPPRVFKMIRNGDESGVSGTGLVLWGVEFPRTGQVVVCWYTENSSITLYDSFLDFENIHINAHPGNDTEIVWARGAQG